MSTATAFFQAPLEGTNTTMPRAADTSPIDVTRLSLPIQIAILLGSVLITSLGAVWATQRNTDNAINGANTAIISMQGDVRVLLEQRKSDADLARMRDDAVKVQLDNMREEIKSLKANSQLLQLQQQQLQLELAKGKR